MNAYYKKIEAPIDDDNGMYLYVVYTRDIRFEQTHPECDTRRLMNIYDKEDTAKAVVNAINEVLIWKTKQYTE